MNYFAFAVFGTISTFAAVLCNDNNPTLLQLHERNLSDRANSNRQKSTSCDSDIIYKELRERRNKILVRDFYQEVFGDKNVSAIDKYINKDIYIQHNPNVADGRHAFKEAAAEWFKNAPRETINVQRISADGDLVWVHTKSTSDVGKLTSCIDVFRIHLGKIFEHWDVIQEVPEKSANTHPMF